MVVLEKISQLSEGFSRLSWNPADFNSTGRKQIVCSGIQGLSTLPILEHRSLLLSALYTYVLNSDLQKTWKSRILSLYHPMSLRSLFFSPFPIHQYPVFPSVSFSTIAWWCVEQVFYHLLQIKKWRICPGKILLCTCRSWRTSISWL